MKPRILFVSRVRYRLPLSASLARKWDALSEVLDLRVLASGAVSDGRFRLVPPLARLDGPVFWALLPLRIARELRDFRPEAVVAQSAYEAAAALVARRLARVPARVIVEVHGDWRTATRLYGSPARAALAPVGDRMSTAALRRADAVRTISGYTTGLVRAVGIEPAATFPAFMDLDPFLADPRPLPPEPRALFVGVLERYKNIDGLAAAWRLAAPRVPGATLTLVGKGTDTEPVVRLLADLPEQTTWVRELPTDGVVRALDDASLLVLPSRSEGLGRVVIEALLRGRPVLGARVGGIPDIVRDGENGVLVEPEPEALADALVGLLADRAELERLAVNARPSVEGWVATPEDYARRVLELVRGCGG